MSQSVDQSEGFIWGVRAVRVCILHREARDEAHTFAPLPVRGRVLCLGESLITNH